MKISITTPQATAPGLIQIARGNGHSNTLSFELPGAGPVDSCALRTKCAERAAAGQSAGCSSAKKPGGCPFGSGGHVAGSLIPGPLSFAVSRYIQQGLERDGRVLVEGPVASGKLTFLQQQTPDAVTIGCNSSLGAYQLVGRYTADRGPVAFKPAAFAEAVSSGKTVVLDDVGLLPRDTQKFIAHVMVKGECPPTYCGLSHHDSEADPIPEEGRFKVHPETRFAATFTSGARQELAPELEEAFRAQR